MGVYLISAAVFLFLIAAIVVGIVLLFTRSTCKLSLFQEGQTLAEGERILYQTPLQSCLTPGYRTAMITHPSSHIVFTNYRVVIFQKAFAHKEYTILRAIILSPYYKDPQWAEKLRWGMSPRFFQRFSIELSDFSLEGQNLDIFASAHVLGKPSRPFLNAKVSPIDALQFSAWRQTVQAEIDSRTSS